MPYIETPPDLAEWLADQIGVWGGNERSPWVADVTERIREAVANERMIEQHDPPRPDIFDRIDALENSDVPK